MTPEIPRSVPRLQDFLSLLFQHWTSIWAWRADHGNGVGCTVNTADTSVIVDDDVITAYGLFVEHYQKYQVIWNGKSGRN